MQKLERVDLKPPSLKPIGTVSGLRPCRKNGERFEIEKL
jgi:hypothetical protein